MRLDFIIVGTQKGGTTALDYFLRKNSSVQMAQTKKEIHFFDNENFDWKAPDYRVYHSNFEWSSKFVVRGEATPIYMYWPQSIGRIKAYNPDVRLICLLRHPSFRAFSQWKMERARGVETLDFSEAIRSGRNRIIENPGCLRIFDYIERGLYSTQVVRLLANFDRSQILFITSDSFRKSLSSSLDKVARFIGARGFSEIINKRIVPVEDQTRNDLSASDLLFLNELFRNDIYKTMELTGCELTAWLDANYMEPEIWPQS